MPKVGEYWFVKFGLDVFIARIVSMKDKTCIIKVSGCLFDKDIEELICKWEPNWLWRFFGYK